ncbi:3-phosphoshikimate 1-carboxyvinyltransferase [Bacillus coahuilensis]|uniref:3-phosphoshikimate 1-carboxyvinyltransferase n=1 Tax=Bacillus coahuilensis TaxID=408580 RepID=UPI0001851030|nr:3-phosphoshikimate 1-carboxyvinyltransferase [Bacillus coahuilensis]
MTRILHRTNNQPLSGTIEVPGDKSISHRSIMFGALADGTTTVQNFLMGEDCLSTMECFKKLGVDITIDEDLVTINGKGIQGLKEPIEVLDVGNSGTTARLMLGILSGLPFYTVIQGDQSIGRRPMKRVVAPLREMGAIIHGRNNGEYTPLSIIGNPLSGITYKLPVASAQVKSAILLAGLHAEGETVVIEPEKSRNHTEKMIEYFGGKIHSEGQVIRLNGNQTFTGRDVYVPGDISSAAFFLVAAAIVPGSKVTIENVGLNPTRTGIIEVLEKMGANIVVELNDSTFEPIGTVTVEYSELQGIEIGGDLIPKLIDEIPIIALLATQCKGETIIKDASELKVKETNRIDAVVDSLKKLGASIEGTDDGMMIKGSSNLIGAEVSSLGDHRIGMMLGVASYLTNSPITLHNDEAVAISYPTFFEHLQKLIENN